MARKPRTARTPEKPPLSEAEMVDILEDIARNGQNQAARIAAIKALREIRGEVARSSNPFDDLDGPARAGVRLKAVK